MSELDFTKLDVQKRASEVQGLSGKGINFCVSNAKKSYVKKDYEASASWVYLASTIAWSMHPGYFYSDDMEVLLNKISNDLFSRLESSEEILHSSEEVPLESTARVLHVLSTASGSGGHSRVAAQWIENCNEYYPGQKHSICLTQQRITGIPEWMLHGVREKGGSISVLPVRESLLGKASLLRHLAEDFDVIVLYIHPNDPIVNLAFSCSMPLKKIVFFNHADHVFSLGARLCDAVLDFRLSGQRITLEERSCLKSFLVPIPLVDKYKNDGDRMQRRLDAREYLGLDLECRIILTVGDEYKYKKALGYDFSECVRKITKDDQNVIVYAIGIPASKFWKKFSDEVEGKFIPVGRIKDRNILEQYYLAADIYMEGFPFSSLTAMIEAGLYQLPIQRMHNSQAPILSGDDIALDGIVSVACNEADYAAGVIKLIHLSEKERNELGHDVRDSIIKNHCGDGWVSDFLRPAIKNIFSDRTFDRDLISQRNIGTSISDDKYEQEKISLTLFQLANSGTVSLTVSALANSSISIRCLLKMSMQVYLHLWNEISAKGSLSLIGLTVMVITVRVLPMQLLRKLRKLCS